MHYSAGLKGVRGSESSSLQDLQRMLFAGVKEAGWEPKSQEAPTYRLLLDDQKLQPTLEAIHKFGKAAVAAIKAHEDSPAFLAPVAAEEVPDYYDIIKVVFEHHHCI